MDERFTFLAQPARSPIDLNDPALKPIPLECLHRVENALTQLLHLRSDVSPSDVYKAIDGALPQELSEFVPACTMRVLAGIRHAIAEDVMTEKDAVETAFTMDGELRWYLSTSYLHACLTAPLVLERGPGGGVLFTIEQRALERESNALGLGKAASASYVCH